MNGAEASEFLLSAYTAGEMNVPVILVAGDAQLIKDDVTKQAPLGSDAGPEAFNGQSLCE